MNGDIERLVAGLKEDPRVLTYPEAATKQAIVLPLLQLLGWDTRNVDEVCPDFPVQGAKIDYCLRTESGNHVLLEVVSVRDDLGRHKERLSRLCAKQQVQMVSVTNGVSWHFAIQAGDTAAPLEWFRWINALKQPSTDAAQGLVDLLCRENVRSGRALQRARSMLADARNEAMLGIALAGAWNRIVREPDSLLVELLGETVERDTGLRPSKEQLERFLREVVGEVRMLPKETPPTPSAAVTWEPVGENVETIKQEQLVAQIVRALRELGGRAPKREVEKVVYRRLAKEFRDEYWHEKVAHGVERWRHWVAWAKERAKHLGLVKPPADSGKGIWELTQKGWEYK